MSGEIIQKAAEWGKQSANLRKAFGTVDALVSQRRGYHWQPKYDGIHAIFDLEKRRAYTRESTPLPSVQHLVERMVGSFGPHYVLQGEVWNEGVAFKDISGAARRQYLQPHLGCVMYDVHLPMMFNAGRSFVPYRHRLGVLRQLCANFNGDPFIRIADSYPTDDMKPIGGWSVLAQEYVNRGGYDGLILRDLDASWETGTAREGQLIKIKPTVTLDLRCNGAIPGVGKHAGKLGALSVSYKGVNTAVGTGFSDDERERMWRAACDGRPGNELLKDNPIGKIIEVEAMAVNPNNTLREPRFKAVRWDKTEADA